MRKWLALALCLLASPAWAGFGLHGSRSGQITPGAIMPDTAEYYGEPASLCPGATTCSWAPYVQGLGGIPGQQGSSTQEGYNDPATAVWVSPVLNQRYDSGLVLLCVKAYHPSGINEVGFAVNAGTIYYVTSTITFPSLGTGSVPLYCATVAANAFSLGIKRLGRLSFRTLGGRRSCKVNGRQRH